MPLWDFHRSNSGRGHECGHFCHPSAPQLALYEMVATIQQHVPVLPLDEAISTEKRLLAEGEQVK